MLSIAVCDDAMADLQMISAMLQEYLKLHSLTAEVKEFSHPDDLLEACARKPFRLYLLDIVMPMVNGIEVGRELRRSDMTAQIIYTTSEPGFALDAYTASPANYLLKPICKEQFFEAMDYALSHLKQDTERTVTVKTRNGYQTLSTEEILICEYINHSVNYTLRNGNTVQSATYRGDFVSCLGELFETGHFIQIHASYVVHLYAIRKLTRTEAELINGRVLPVSRSRYEAVKEAYLSYRLGGEADG